MRNLEVTIFQTPLKWGPEIEAVYDLYCEIWGKTWKELGIPKQNSDDFCRMKAHAGFSVDGQFVGYHGYDWFDLERKCDRAHSYFQRLPAGSAEALTGMKIVRVATMENLAVLPEFRRLEGYSVADIIGGFSTQYLKSWNPDALLGLARKDRSIDHMCMEYGGFAAFDGLVSYGVPTVLMAFRRDQIKESERTHVRSTVRRLLAAVGVAQNQTSTQGAA